MILGEVRGMQEKRSRLLHGFSTWTDRNRFDQGRINRFAHELARRFFFFYYSHGEVSAQKIGNLLTWLGRHFAPRDETNSETRVRPFPCLSDTIVTKICLLSLGYTSTRARNTERPSVSECVRIFMI